MRELDRAEMLARAREILQQHQGPDDCITMTELYYQVTGEAVIPWKRYDQSRVIRSIVEQLRQEGARIGRKGGKHGGYFWARNDEEMMATAEWFHSRAMSALKQEAAIKRVTTKELIKQYETEFNEGEQTPSTTNQ